MGKGFAGMRQEMAVGLIIYVMEEYQMHLREERKREKCVKTTMNTLSRIIELWFSPQKNEMVVGRGFFSRQLRIVMLK